MALLDEVNTELAARPTIEEHKQILTQLSLMKVCLNGLKYMVIWLSWSI